jgi:DNA-binding GntR family transcriptional regulator
MERSLARQKKALDSPNTRNSFIEEDHRFHLLLVHYADNDEFSHLFQRLMYMIHLTTANALAIDGRAQATYDEHEELYRSLKDEDGDKAYRILIAHLLMPLNMDLL